MNFNTAPIRNWFGHSRRERRASFILLILILFVISVRLMVPDNRNPIKYMQLEFEASETVAGAGPPVNESHDDKIEVTLVKRSVDTFSKSVSWNVSSGKRLREQPYRNKKNLIIDINRSDTSELIKLPGIGPVLSARIIKYRQLLGGFACKEQLREVYGLPGETYDLIKDMIFVDTLIIRKISINAADFKTLDRMPYFDRYELTAILKFRELAGRIRNIDELTDNKIISKDKALKVRPYLQF